MDSTFAMPPMEPTSRMACMNSFASRSGQDGWFFNPGLMGWSLSSAFSKSLRFHLPQCAVFFSHSAYVETSESWLSTHGSQMHFLPCWSSSGDARLLSSRGGSSAVAIPVHPSVDGCSSARTGASCVGSGPKANQCCATGPDPWLMAGSDR